MSETQNNYAQWKKLDPPKRERECILWIHLHNILKNEN